IVREGDYGHSAFMVLSGQVRVVLAGLSPQQLGRQEPEPIGWLAAMARSLMRPKLPEVRDALPTEFGAASAFFAAPRGSLLTTHEPGAEGEPRIFLQDVPRVLEETNTVVLEAGEMFGELAALTRSPRSATVFAEGEALLL